jgi:hypothetical protein
MKFLRFDDPDLHLSHYLLMRREHTMSKLRISLLALIVVGGAATYGLSTLTFADTNEQPQIESIATAAVVFDINRASYFRLNSVATLSDFTSDPVSELNNVHPATPYHHLVSRLTNLPDFSKKFEFTSDMKNVHMKKIQQFEDMIFDPTGSYATNNIQVPSLIPENDDNTEAFQVDAGVRNLSWSVVNIDDSTGTATLQGQGDGWASFALWNNGGYTFETPNNISNYTVTLDKVNGQWKVDDLSHTFAPGSEP